MGLVPSLVPRRRLLAWAPKLFLSRTAAVALSGALVGTGALLSPRMAEASSRTMRVDYAVDAACPSEATFVDFARARVREWPVSARNPDLLARARAQREGAVFVGRLELEDASGSVVGAREIREASCEDVVLALALFLAVALEADADSSQHAPTDAGAAAPIPDEPVRTPAVAPANPVPTRSSSVVSRRPPSPADSDHDAWYLTGGVHAVSGRTPALAAGASVGLAFRPGIAWPVVPYASLAFDAAPYSTVARDGGHVSFAWAGVTAAGCLAFSGSHRQVDAEHWEPWGCARFEAGGLRAASHGYDVDKTGDVRTWLAAGAGTGVLYWFDSRIGIGLDANAVVPLVRQTFFLNDEKLFRTPAVAAELGIDVRLRVW